MFKNWSTKRLQMAVVTGLLLGVTTPFAAMMMRSHQTEAAVAVFDQKNIEEAIKTAITTAKILTTEEKELGLMILDAKKINLDMLQGWMRKNKKAEDLCKTIDIVQDIVALKKEGKIPSILNVNSSATAILKNEIGAIEDAINGKMTLVDFYKQTQKNHKRGSSRYYRRESRLPLRGYYREPTKRSFSPSSLPCRRRSGTSITRKRHRQRHAIVR